VVFSLGVPAIASAGLVYHANLSPLNNSGVKGTIQMTLNGDSLSVNIHVTGLEPNKVHTEHIHGFVNGKNSVIPTLSKFDFNKNGRIDDDEGELAVGPVILPLWTKSEGTILGPYPTAPKGIIDFRVTYTAEEVKDLPPLTKRAVEIHGKTVDGMYNPEFPVAVGLVKAGPLPGKGTPAASNSGGSGGSGGASAVPLPAAVWPGLLMFGGLVAARSGRRTVAGRSPNDSECHSRARRRGGSSV